MIQIEKASIDDAQKVFRQVILLLDELREEDDASIKSDIEKITEAWKENNSRFNVFMALDDSGSPVGVITLAESFAIYAGGNYGIINELYVAPEYRSRGVGRMLLDAIKDFAREKGWERVDVTAPTGEKWRRTVAFYEREGFAFTGPKMKFLVDKPAG